MGKSANSVACSAQLLFVLCVLCACSCLTIEAATATRQELLRGFKATPNPSVESFQSLLNDSTDTFSLGFLRINSKQLALGVVHLPSSEQLWLANPTQLSPWSDRTELIFNGSLVMSGSHGRVFWSTGTGGQRVVLLNSSNVQIQKLDDSLHVVWQSFDFPTNTLVENQNFTTNMSLVSSNGLYSMRLGSDFIGLYAKFNEKSEQIYLRHKALEAKADIVEGKGPIYARVNSDGFLGMYQVGNTVPVDVEAFTNFQRQVSGLLLVRLEPDGNLKGYYWDGSNWVLNYQAISDTCELPSSCGSYGLCKPGSGCSCLDNRTEHSYGECIPSTSGNFCLQDKASFWVLRRKGVELPFKELIRYEMTSFLEECEDKCEKNCSCWGAVYNNASGFCYMLDYPIQTLLGVGDESKVGYFKVREGAGKKKMDVGFGVGIGILSGSIVISIGVILFESYKIWRRRRGVLGSEEEDGVLPGPYKNLGSASFRSIEMCNTPR
ncbi:PAN domain-containing protein [Melia azedarach]|uniref:PAN domain-containing protein n=1 Tax=Melia azedarach TaxID=155640 RepID=A0ACC1X1D5_MELAZ|nr:PAN domain-containing protein [Melia azedarach]